MGTKRFTIGMVLLAVSLLVPSFATAHSWEEELADSVETPELQCTGCDSGSSSSDGESDSGEALDFIEQVREAGHRVIDAIELSPHALWDALLDSVQGSMKVDKLLEQEGCTFVEPSYLGNYLPFVVCY